HRRVDGAGDQLGGGGVGLLRGRGGGVLGRDEEELGEGGGGGRGRRAPDGGPGARVDGRHLGALQRRVRGAVGGDAEGRDRHHVLRAGRSERLLHGGEERLHRRPRPDPEVRGPRRDGSAKAHPAMSGSDAAEPSPAETEKKAAAAMPGGSIQAAIRAWASAHRVELMIFAGAFVALACFSSQRFLRQSEAPHFVYQAKAWLDGRMDLDPRVLPNLEDWACVREVGGAKVRCEGRVQATDRWYVSFPAFP